MKKLSTLILVALALLLAAPAANAERWTNYRIMLDPGHGGSDPGASGPQWPHEAELALRCSHSIRERLENVGAPVRMTRTTDATVSLAARRSASISYDPYIFCSVHLNAFNSSAHGTETWYYWPTGNSKFLAEKVQAQLVSCMKRANRGVKQNGWTVITGAASIPAILTEGLFVDNWEEWNLINDNSKDGFKNWVNGHLAGFRDHMRAKNNGNLDDPTVDDAKAIYVSTENVNLSCDRYGHPYADITVSTKNITENLSIWSDDNSLFTVDKTSLGSGGGSFRVTFQYSDWYHYKGSYVHVRANGVQKDIRVTCDVKGSVLPELSEGWNVSAKRGNASSKGYDATQIRNFCYLNGKLYCVYKNSRIIVLHSQTGEKLGELKLDGVGEGTLALCDVKAISGKIVACNLATTANGNWFCIYKWDDDNSAPKKILNTQDFQGVARIGDCMEVVGTLDSDAWFCFMNDNAAHTETRIVEYHQTGEYNFAAKYTKAYDNNKGHMHTGATSRAYPSNGNYWVDGNACHPMWCTWDQGYDGVSPLVTNSTEGQTQGASHHEFYYHGWKYAANLVFRGSTNYTAPKLRILRDNVGNFSKCDEKREYPWDGLGDAQNTNGTGDVIVNCNGADYCEAWVMSTNHGLAYYRTGDVPAVNPGQIGRAEIWFSERDPEMRAKVGDYASKTIRVEGKNVHAPINLEPADSDGGKSTGVISIEPTQLDGPGDVVVTYRPTDHSVNWIWVRASTADADDAYMDVHAESYKDPTVTADGDATFSCYADAPQTHVFNVTARNLKGWIGSGIWGNNESHNSQFSQWNDWGLANSTTVYFNNNRAGWDKVYVWLWNKDNANYNYQGVDYPGVQLYDRGDGIFEYTFTPGALSDNIGILFNNGLEADGKKRQQTDDGHVMNGATYWAAGSSAYWRVPGHKVPLMCDIDGHLTVTYRPTQAGDVWSNFYISSDGMPKNLDVVLHGICLGMTGLTDLEGNPVNDVKVTDGTISVDCDNVRDITVYNTAGAVVATAKATNSLRIDRLPAAAYIVGITTDTETRRLKLRL